MARAHCRFERIISLAFGLLFTADDQARVRQNSPVADLKRGVGMGVGDFLRGGYARSLLPPYGYASKGCVFQRARAHIAVLKVQ